MSRQPIKITNLGQEAGIDPSMSKLIPKGKGAVIVTPSNVKICPNCKDGYLHEGAFCGVHCRTQFSGQFCPSDCLYCNGTAEKLRNYRP